MNIQKVEERRKGLGITVPQMAAELGMDPSTYYRKLQKNGEGFNAVDLNIFKRVLHLNAQEALDFLL
jgi:transcriptional regulator with XRE-family HTH domain